jgi:opacity protein-like surface antigen
MNRISLRTGFAIFFVLCLCLGLAAGTARAQNQSRMMLTTDRLYTGIAVGPIWSQDVNVQLSGPITGSGRLLFNPAGFIGGFAGYDLSDQLALEAEVDWSLYDPFSLSGSFIGPNGRFSGLALDGDFNTILGMASLIYRPLGKSSRFVPYIGTGIGFADLDWSITNRPGSATLLSVRGTQVDFAADFRVGLNYDITTRISVGGAYRLVWMDANGGTLSGGGVTLVHGDAYAHIFTATASYRF